MLSVTQLITTLTYEQVRQKLYDAAEALGLPTRSWFAGAPTRTIIAIIATIYATFLSPLIVTLAKSGFLDDAEGSWLTLLASLVYGVTRRPNTFASGSVALTNAGGGVFPFDIGEAVFKNSTTGATYTNTESFSLAAFGTVTVSVRAVDAGSAGSADVGQIDTIVTTMQLVTVTNAAALTGQDEETDPDLRQRCRDALGALSPDGPAAAYRYVALTPALNGGANINRVKVLDAPGDGTLTVVIASPDGAPSGGDVALVQTGFDEWATPDNTVATATAASEVAWSVAATVHVDAAAGLSDAEWIDLIKTGLLAWNKTIPIGGLTVDSFTGIPWRGIVGVIERQRATTQGEYHAFNAKLTSETDIPMTGSQVATLVTGDITISIVQVSLA